MEEVEGAAKLMEEKEEDFSEGVCVCVVFTSPLLSMS